MGPEVLFRGTSGGSCVVPVRHVALGRYLSRIPLFMPESLRVGPDCRADAFFPSCCFFLGTEPCADGRTAFAVPGGGVHQREQQHGAARRNFQEGRLRFPRPRRATVRHGGAAAAARRRRGPLRLGPRAGPAEARPRPDPGGRAGLLGIFLAAEVQGEDHQQGRLPRGLSRENHHGVVVQAGRRHKVKRGRRGGGASGKGGGPGLRQGNGVNGGRSRPLPKGRTE
ncbi:unnamed protein product [Phaeothamnion confervicola]